MTRPRRPGRAQQERHASGPSLELPAWLGESLSAGHPWIYRNHVPSGAAFANGTWVHVRAGGFSGYALWDASSPIALRVYSRKSPPDAYWFRARVAEARALREPLVLEDTNAYRLLFGEGDGVPGLTVDVYDRYAVLVTYADSLEVVVEPVVAALTAELSLDGVLHKRSRSASGERLALVWGREPPADLVVRERAVQLRADLAMGQKTGLFLDHRDNRAFVRAHAGSARVLNLFAYTGAFSVYAALGGARRVTSVDIAAKAIAAARDNFALNGIDASLHEFVAADVFEYLETARARGQTFDLVICDPPSFAGSKDQQRAAIRAYVKLHALGLSVVEPSGLYAAASCTAQVSPDALRLALAQAADRADRRFQLVHDVGQPFDHPVMSGHPEGRYLKFMLGRVLRRV